MMDKNKSYKYKWKSIATYRCSSFVKSVIESSGKLEIWFSLSSLKPIQSNSKFENKKNKLKKKKKNKKLKN